MSGIIVDVIILAIILIPTIRGYWKGITEILYGFLATIVAVIVALLLFRPVAGVIMDKTTVDEYLTTSIYDIVKDVEVSEDSLIDPEKTDMSEQLVNIINKYLAEAINNSVDDAAEYVSVKIAHLMVNLLTLIFIIIILRIILAFFKSALDALMDLPFLKQIDSMGGMAVGFIKGFLIVYVIFAIFSVFSPIMEENGVLGMIQDSKVGSFLYNNNIVLNVISSKL